MPRLFVALDLPEPVRERLALVRWSLPGARWVEADALHLTLAFIGEVDGPTARRVEDGLSVVSAAPFVLRTAGFGCFPPRGAPRVLWAGLETSEALVGLAGAVRRRLRRLSVPVDRRNFSPHVTLARLKGTTGADVIAGLSEREAPAGLEVPVRAFALFSSVLGKGGPVYRREAAYPLREP